MMANVNMEKINADEIRYSNTSEFLFALYHCMNLKDIKPMKTIAAAQFIPADVTIK
jgi:hypothetical protein